MRKLIDPRPLFMVALLFTLVFAGQAVADDDGISWWQFWLLENRVEALEEAAACSVGEDSDHVYTVGETLVNETSPEGTGWVVMEVHRFTLYVFNYQVRETVTVEIDLTGLGYLQYHTGFVADSSCRLPTNRYPNPE